MSSRAACAFAWSLAVLSSAAAGDGPRSTPRSVDVRLGGPFRLAVAAASGRLSSAPCAAVLDRFVDSATGLPLGAALEATSLSAAEFVLGLTYYDASALPSCRNERTLAYTSPGSRVVFVCPTAFSRAARAEPGFAANVLIHEVLHSLGLSENPPSSEVISLQVRIRCGM